jgi:hypothetical protein
MIILGCWFKYRKRKSSHAPGRKLWKNSPCIYWLIQRKGSSNKWNLMK